MPSNVKAIPAGHHSITPTLICRNAASAIDFYKKAFGAKEISRAAGPDGKIMHAELEIGDSRIMLGDEMPGTTAPDPNSKPSSSLYLYVPDVDSVFNSAVKAGAKSNMAPENMFWGDRYGKLVDPFGHFWDVATHVEDVSPEEMDRRFKDMMAKMAKPAGQSA